MCSQGWRKLPLNLLTGVGGMKLKVTVSELNAKGH